MTDQELEKMVVESLNDVFEISGNEGFSQDLSGVSFVGVDSIFDSLTLIHFISSLERKLRDHTNKDIKLVDDRAFDPEKSPFKNFKTLKSLTLEKLNE